MHVCMAKLVLITHFMYFYSRMAKSLLFCIALIPSVVVGGGGRVRSTEVANQNVCGRFFNSRITGQHLLVLEAVVEPAFGVQ